jgi:hypothetical protein
MDGMDFLAIEKNTLGERSLARVDMGGNADISHLVNVYGHLVPSPHCVEIDVRLMAPFLRADLRMAAWLNSVREVEEKTAVCSHLVENLLPAYSIEKPLQLFNTRKPERFLICTRWTIQAARNL